MKRKLTLFGASCLLLPFFAQAAITEYPVPFTDSFPPDGKFGSELSRWIVVDGNENGTDDWVHYSGEGYNGIMGYAACLTYGVDKPGDCLVTKLPIRLEEGFANISFFYRGGPDYIGEGTPEAFDVYYGTTSNIDEMQLLAAFDSFSLGDWEFFYKDFEVQSGAYYFAFVAKSETNSNRISIDDLKIDGGKFVQTSDMKAVAAVLPLGRCSLSEEKIGVEVTNVGTKAADAITGAYRINGGEWVEETFTETVQVDEKKVLYFKQLADFSAIGNYEVEIKVASADQIYTFNDNCSGTVRVGEAKTVPYQEEFNDDPNLTWYPEVAGDWTFYNGEYAPKQKGSGFLVSGCFSLQPGSYRMSLAYSAGLWGYPENTTEDFQILMGVSGTPTETWKVIKDYKDKYEEVTVTESFLFSVEEFGEYAFAIRALKGDNLSLQSVGLDAVKNSDAKLVGIEHDYYARLMPKGILEGEDVEETIVMTNNGSDDAEVKIVAKQNDEVVYESKLSMIIAPEDTMSFTLPLQLKNLTVGQKVKLEYSLQTTEEDANPEDNVLIREFEVSEDTYAFDNVTDFSRGIGNQEGETGLGKIFNVKHEDVLSSVDIAFAVREGNVPFDLRIFEVDENNITRLIYENRMEREEIGDFQTFDIEPLLLEKGRYFVEVAQIGNQYLGLGYEKAEAGVHEMRNYWVYNDTYFRPDSLMTLDGMWLGIRPKFEKDAVARKLDLKALRFTAPFEKDLMLKNEPIKVVYQNMGYEALKNVEFKCLVDGVEVASTTVPEIAPYQMEFEVVMEADLTALGKHVIEVYPVLEGDENPDNDRISMEVESIEEGDPYVMDFELCTPFATDRMNPRWQSVDRDGGVALGYMIGYVEVKWPGWGSPAGFIAFNPLLTEPSSEGFFKEGFQGKQFGAAFSPSLEFGATEAIQSNDWLISPKLKLGENPAIEFLAKSQTDNYGGEEYNVLVSTTGTEEADFVKIGETRKASEEWEQVKVSLADYKNQEVYVAIQCVSKDQFIFLVDDIRVIYSEQSGALTDVAVDCACAYDAENAILTVRMMQDAATDRIATVSLFNMSGMTVLYQEIGDMSARIGLHNLPAGIYVCRVTTQNGIVKNAKILVE